MMIKSPLYNFHDYGVAALSCAQGNVQLIV
jgi:hypothetical protein